MAKPKDGLKEDVQDLVKSSVIEEAVEASWMRFEKAMENLEPESTHILSAFLGGQSPERIARNLGTTADEVRALIDRAKRDLRNQIRSKTPMKQ